MKRITYSTFSHLLATFLILATSFVAQAEPTTSTFSHTAPSTYSIQAIEVTGNQSLETEAIVAISGLQVGDTIQLPGPATKEAIQRLWKQDLIQDASVYATPTQGQHVILTIAVVESPRLADYTFIGVDKKEQKKMLEKVTLKEGQAITDASIQHVKKTFLQYLTEQGYRDAKITLTTQPVPKHDNHIHLTITINKGKKYLVNAIHIQGNHSISSDILKAKMRHTREKARLSLFKDIFYRILTLRPIRKEGALWKPLTLETVSNYVQKHVIFSSSKLDKAKFEEDKKGLITFCQSQGFRDARIVSESIEPLKDGLLDVHLTIEEGEKYFIKSIRWVGNKLHDADTLSKILALQPGDIYNPSLIQQRLNGNPMGEDVAGIYADDGHLFFHASPVEVGTVDNAVDLEIRIQEGPQAYINKIIIEGNTMTHDHVLRRELRTLPGDKFSRTKVQRSLREIALLEIVDPAVEVLPIPNLADETVDIKYKVKEKPKGDIQASLSYGAGEFIGGGATNFNNFSLSNALKGRLPAGDGQTIGLSIKSNGKDYRSLSLQFTEPWLGGKRPSRLHFSISGSYYELPSDIDRYVDQKKLAKERARVPLIQNGKPTVVEYLSNDQAWAKIYSMGLQLAWGTRLRWPDDYCSVSSGLAFLREAYEDYTPPGINKKRVNGALNDIHANLSISRNSIDIPVYPTEGSTLELYASITPPYAWFSDKAKLFKGKNTWKEYHQWLLDGAFFWNLFYECVFRINGQAGFVGSFSPARGVGPFKRFHMGGVIPATRSLIGQEEVSLRGYSDSSIAPVDRKKGYKGGVMYEKISAELRYPIIKSPFAFLYGLIFAEAGNTWARYGDYKLRDIKTSAGFGVRAQVAMLGMVAVQWGYGFNKKLKRGEANHLELHVSLGGGGMR